MIVFIIILSIVILYAAAERHNMTTDSHTSIAIKKEFDEIAWSNSSNPVLQDILVIGTNYKVAFKYGSKNRGMKAILSEHHPKYWDGHKRSEHHSLFDETTTMKDIIHIAEVIINQSQDNKDKAVIKRKENISLDGQFENKKYRVIVSPDMEVVTVYPYGWNIVD